MPLLTGHEVYGPIIAGQINGLVSHSAKAVRLATTAALAANTYAYPTLTANANGALSVDGVAVAVGDLVLVKNEATGSNNGIYQVTATGGASAKYVLSRSSLMNITADLRMGLLVTTGPEGTAHPNATFSLTTTGPFTLDTTALTFTKIASAIEYGAPIATFTKTAADGAAATTTAETVLGMIGPTSGGNIANVYFIPAAALTANDTNYATIQVQKRTAGGAAVTVAQVTTQTVGGGGSGNWTAWQPVAIPIVAGTVSALDALTFNIAKPGTGVVVPAGQLNVVAG